MWPMDTKVAVLLAAYVVHEVKGLIDGCGKETDIACVGPNRGCFLYRKHVQELEPIFDALSGVQSAIMHSAFSAESGPSTKEIGNGIRSIRKKLDRIWKGFEAELT
jgi:hypothetical protein